jgi:PPP family 3-phenylpropionic acid transporter
VALGFVQGVGPILAVWALHCLAAFPLMPLQDGVCFSLQRRHAERGEVVRPFYLMRVWGTIGYMAPSLILFGLFRAGMPIQGALMSGAAFALLAAAQAPMLDDPRAPNAASSNSAVGPSKLPTFGAAAALFQPSLIGFSIAVFFGQMAATIYGAYYPIYLTDPGQVGLQPQWVGLVTNVGVLVEIVFVFSTGRLVDRFGFRMLMAASLLLVAVRMGLLAASHHPTVGIGTQLFHGVQIVGLTIAPQMFADRLATDRFRHSMQGVLILLIGLGRAAGSLSGGAVARHGLASAFAYAAALSVAGALSLAAFRVKRETPAVAAAS